jgi:hypothetical protein
MERVSWSGRVPRSGSERIVDDRERPVQVGDGNVEGGRKGEDIALADLET